MNVPFNPMAVGSFGGNFQIDSGGYIQGEYLQDPVSRFALATGVVGPNETLPMHGGVAITEALSSSVLGNTLTRANSDAAIAGFAVFTQAHNGILMQGNGLQVPVNFPGQTMPFFRLGSGARIPVACDASLASLVGGSVSPQVTWDYNLQMLVPYDAATATVNVTSITSSYNAATQMWTFVVVAAAAANVAAVGDIINVAGVTGTGAALVNGLQKITAFTNNQNFSFQIKDTDGSGADFAVGAQAGAITLVQATGALSVKVLDVQIGNSKVVRYVAGAPQLFSWENTGSAALIQI